MQYLAKKILTLGLSSSLGLLSLLYLPSCGVSSRSTQSDVSEYKPRKREFRGAWLPTIFRSEYTGLSRAEGRKILANRIELLHRAGCNVVLFQVRAEGDAWYRSNHEPWSRFFTGEQGKELRESWDPLAFVIEECHKRGMELHAWINPYRGASSVKTKLADNHLAKRQPELFIKYNNQLVLDPGRPESRKHVLKVVQDMVSRYEFDALHLDDYFYPYPANGQDFPDDETFSSYGLTAGYRPEEKADWRRSNVNMLIHDIRQLLLRTKPWVRFGVSPFGIYRNASTDPRGSRTNGLQNYDDLYADVVHWANEGWVDYVVPQLYWNIGYEVADHEELVSWWRRAIRNKNVQLYIGQDVKRTQDAGQLSLKMFLSAANSEGNVFWPGDELVRNYKDMSEELRTVYQRYPALLPEYKAVLGKTRAPKKIEAIWEDRNEDGHMIVWSDEHIATDPESAHFYVVYGFAEGQKPSIDKAENIMAITNRPQYKLPHVNGRTKYTFLVTSVNRFWQESKPYKVQVKL